MCLHRVVFYTSPCIYSLQLFWPSANLLSLYSEFILALISMNLYQLCTQFIYVHVKFFTQNLLLLLFNTTFSLNLINSHYKTVCSPHHITAIKQRKSTRFYNHRFSNCCSCRSVEHTEGKQLSFLFPLIWVSAHLPMLT